MKKEAYFSTAEELARGGLETIPPDDLRETSDLQFSGNAGI